MTFVWYGIVGEFVGGPHVFIYLFISNQKEYNL